MSIAGAAFASPASSGPTVTKNDGCPGNYTLVSVTEYPDGVSYDTNQDGSVCVYSAKKLSKNTDPYVDNKTSKKA